MTIVERKLRESIWIKVRNHSAEAIDEALSALIDQFGDKYNEVFKSITGDNGSEFANLSQIESKGIAVYFTHPYSSYEKGTNECHNKMLRRFIPKGKNIDDYSADDILTLRIRSTTCPERFWATEPRKSCSSRNSTAYMLPREPRRREFSSLVPRITRGDLLQTQKLLQLAIAICE